MIAEGRITHELAVEHVRQIKHHRALGTSVMWLHKGSARVRLHHSKGSTDENDWFWVFPTGSFVPEKALGRAVNVWVRARGEVTAIALPRNVQVRVRRGKAYVYPMTPGGVSWVIEPVIVTNIDENEIADAIGLALDAAPTRSPERPDFRDPNRSDPLRDAGVRSDIGSKLFSLRFATDETSIYQWQPNRGGGFVNPELLQSMSVSATTHEVARAIIEALPNAPEK